ncbi:hypothetical protein EDB87DRAFT_1576918 [Lactarius vividus]|nr:hypothetical protein EDB87DRAFT_1576918 [Lactarius vividus]
MLTVLREHRRDNWHNSSSRRWGGRGKSRDRGRGKSTGRGRSGGGWQIYSTGVLIWKAALSSYDSPGHNHLLISVLPLTSPEGKAGREVAAAEEAEPSPEPEPRPKAEEGATGILSQILQRLCEIGASSGS